MNTAPETVNIAERMERRLSPDLLAVVQLAGSIADRRQQRCYLVGGAVRDILLDRPTNDIDIVVEGNAIALGRELSASVKSSSLTTHERFGTATLKWPGGSADMASARAETYERPGALPAVRHGTMQEDLARRDFTVNAMAVELNPRHYGELVDPHGGRNDIQRKAIRVLHEQSFVDDATRMWRAVRYEQRLGFAIGPATLLLIKRDLPFLDAISGSRIRHELDLVLKEAEPERMLLRCEELGILVHIAPSMAFDDTLASIFVEARRRLADKPAQLPVLYFALLACQLTQDELETVIDYLHLPRQAAEPARELVALRSLADELAAPGLAPSRLYELLSDYSRLSLTAFSLCLGAVPAEQVELYLNVVSRVNPSLGGNDLKKLGVPEGPQIKELISRLRAARLDGTISSKAEEEALVRDWITAYLS